MSEHECTSTRQDDIEFNERALDRASDSDWGAEKLRSFEDTYAAFLVGESSRSNDDGSQTAIKTYELILDPADGRERRGVLAPFITHAAASGYEQLLGPVSIPGIGYSDIASEHPLTALYLVLGAPTAGEVDLQA